MNTSEMSQIERIFYPGWLMASQLRGGQEVRDGEGLYRRACRLVQEAKAALTEAGYSDISRDHMVYALCALLDESVMNRGTTDDGYPQIININLGRYERVQENIHRRETDEDGDYRW